MRWPLLYCICLNSSDDFACCVESKGFGRMRGRGRLGEWGEGITPIVGDGGTGRGGGRSGLRHDAILSLDGDMGFSRMRRVAPRERALERSTRYSHRMETEDEIYERILLGLQLDHQFIEHVNPDELGRIKQIRDLGRRAGREIGWKIRTIQTDPERRADGKVVVGIVVVESTPEEDARLSERAEFIIRNMKGPTGEVDS